MNAPNTPISPVQTYQALKAILEVHAVDMARRLATAAGAALETIQKRLKALADTSGATILTVIPELSNDVQSALDDFAETASGEIQAAARQGAQGGARVARTILNLLNIQRFANPSLDDLMTMVGLIDSPAYLEWVRDFGSVYAALVREKALSMVGEGASGRAIAGALGDLLKQPYYDAVRMGRTMQVYGARRVQHGIYRLHQDLLRGWVWVSAKDKRTCPGCWAMDGSFHSLDEELNDHFLGRCAPAPVPRLAGGILPRYPTGEEVFRGLPPHDQRAILGEARWRAWRDGLFTFSALTTTYNHALFGSMRREQPLIALVGKDIARAYSQLGRD